MTIFDTIVNTDGAVQGIKGLPAADNNAKIIEAREVLEAARNALLHAEQNVADLRRAFKEHTKQRETEILARWKQWLQEEYAHDLPTSVQHRIYDEAWSLGHSDSLYSVEDHYKMLAAVARHVYVTARNEIEKQVQNLHIDSNTIKVGDSTIITGV